MLNTVMWASWVSDVVLYFFFLFFLAQLCVLVYCCVFWSCNNFIFYIKFPFMTLSFFKIHFHNLVSRIIQSFGLVQMNETDCTVGIMNSSLSFTVLSLVCTNNICKKIHIVCSDVLSSLTNTYIAKFIILCNVRQIKNCKLPNLRR